MDDILDDWRRAVERGRQNGQEKGKREHEGFHKVKRQRCIYLWGGGRREAVTSPRERRFLFSSKVNAIFSWDTFGLYSSS
jgi:hypothetical protein